MVHRAHRTIAAAGAALAFTLAGLIFGTPASAYQDVQVTNTTTFAAQVHVMYHACRSDQVTVAPGATVKVRRANCLVKSITATLTGGPAVRPFTSSGTSLPKFAIVTAGGAVAVEQK